MEKLRELNLKINRARYNLMFMILLSVVNIYFIISNGKILVPFSSSISVYSIFFGSVLKNESTASTPFIVGIIAACVILGAFLLCYFKSKNNPFFMFMSFTLMAADTFVLLAIAIFNSSITDWFNILDILLHILVLYYVFGGIKAHSQLTRIKRSSDSQTAETVNSAPEDDDDATAEEEEEEEEEENIQPKHDDIYKYEDDGTEPLVTGQAEGLSVFAVIRENKAELVINEYVCDELDITCYSEFSLRAIVNNIDFLFEYKTTPNGDMMFLYADDELLDSFGRQ